jgi:predicted HTH transcriptional regulator
MLEEIFQPERVTLTLPFATRTDAQTNSLHEIDFDRKLDSKEIMVVEFLSQKQEATSAMIAAHIGLGQSRARQILAKLRADDIVEAYGQNKTRTYLLKSR